MTEKIQNIYKEAFSKFGDSDQSVLFPKGRQFERFELLVPELPQSQKLSILDYGCGLGKFIDWLSYQNKFNPNILEYTGADITEDFINHNKKKYPNYQFQHIENVNSIQKKYDLIIASGVFSIKYFDDELENKNYVYSCIQQLFQKNTTSCLSIDFMHDQVDYKTPNAFHVNIKDFTAFLENSLTDRYDIIKSKFKYECTFRIWKNDLQIENGIYPKWPARN